MTLNIISTVNGMENEGMRNVASHITRELKSDHKLRLSALGSPVKSVLNSIGADAAVIFARANGKTAVLAKAVRLLCPKVYFVLVQKPEKSFMDKMGRSVVKYSYFSILPSDGKELEDLGAAVYPLGVGINREKFRPAKDTDEIHLLREKYGFSKDMPLVVHVGHLSAGRGLEEFLHLPKEKYQRLVVASGMFNSDEVEEKLRLDGVTIIKEYLPDVSEVYRMADVYLFPTRSAEFVISIPLSVMEALSCGIPVVAFDGVEGISLIGSGEEREITVINSSDELSDAVYAASERFSGKRADLLKNSETWREVSERFLGCIADK